ncbi:hypothetical protein [Pseudomonas sp. Bi70]|uniref:hypothetical protein n=1 Tax=Pseudomonas sp. Bi70 TaxID=2821127 RepID=UPI001E3D58E6|nr:hypothetical protein [Pseudomonas sp. Bi70]
MISKTGTYAACDCRTCGLYRVEGGWIQGVATPLPAEEFRAFLQLQREESPDDTPVISRESARSLLALSQLSTSQAI